MRDLHISEDVAVLGISLYVLGFALGYAGSAFHVELHNRSDIDILVLSYLLP